MSYRNWLKEKRKKRDFLTSKEKNDTHDYNWKDDQGHTENEEKRYKPDLVRETPGTDKIEEVAMFVADNFYNGQYTIEKHSTDCYQFCFGVGDTSSEHAEGKTISEAKGRAVVLEIPSGREDIKSHKKSIKLAADRLAIIQNEKKRSEELKDKLIAKEKESKDLVALADDRLAAINEEKQKNEEMKVNLVIMEKEYAKKINEKEDKIVAKDTKYRKLMRECEDLVSLANDRMAIIQNGRQKCKELEGKITANDAEYDELTMKYRDSEAFISEQAGAIEDNKQKIKELQDNIAAKESKNASLTKEKEKNKAYARMQENIIGKLQEKVNTGENEKTTLMKEKEGLEQERAEIMQVISKFSDSWKSDVIMQPFEEKIATKKEKLPDIVNLILRSIEELRHHLRAPPSIKEMKKSIARANEMFSEGYDNLAIRDELTFYFPEIIEEDVQNLREKWEQKIKPEVKPLVEPEVTEEKEPLELGPKITVIDRHSIFKNPFDEFEKIFCDDEPHHYLKVVKMLKKYDRYNRYKEETLGKVARYYIKHASNFYWISEKTGYGIFRTEGKKSEIERKKVEEAIPKIEEEKYKPLGNVIKDFVAKEVKEKYSGIEGLYTNPVDDVISMLKENSGNTFNAVQIHKHVMGVFENFKELVGVPIVVIDAYLRYIEIYIRPMLIDRTGEGENATYDIMEGEALHRKKVKEKIEKKKILEKKKEFKPIRDKYGKRLYNDATEKVRESYPNATFHKKPVKELSQELNESAKTVMYSLELQEFFRGILEKTYTYVSATRCDYYIKYFRITKMLKYVKEKDGSRYEMCRDSLIPKKKNKMRILDKIGMKEYARDNKVDMS